MDIESDTFDLTIPRTDAEYEVLFGQMMAEIKQMRAQMQSDQIIIERNHEDTQRSAAETRAILDRLEANR